MKDENPPQIYVQGEYAKGKLVHKRYVLDDTCAPTIARDKKEYASLLELATAFKKISFETYINLSAEEIEADEDRVMLRRPLSLRELKWLALNSTRKDRLKNQRNLGVL